MYTPQNLRLHGAGTAKTPRTSDLISIAKIAFGGITVTDDYWTGRRDGFLRGLVAGLVVAVFLDYVLPLIRPLLNERLASDLVAGVVWLLIVAWFLPQLLAPWFGLDPTKRTYPSKAHEATDVTPETPERWKDGDG